MLNKLLATLRAISINLRIKLMFKKVMDQSRREALEEEENMAEMEFH